MDVRAIESHAAIGNGRTVALLDGAGDVDWCCLPRIDSEPVFDALLDEHRGGRFGIGALGERRRQRRYAEGSNVLQTTVEAGSGTVLLTDFLADAGSRLVRVARCTDGRATVRARVRPGRRWRAAASAGRLELEGDGGTVVLAGATDWRDDGDGAWVGTVELDSGRSAAWILDADGASRDLPDGERLLRDAERAVAADQAWVGRAAIEGEFAAAVRRSLLALRLLVDRDTGAIAAAGTTSLPERIGGVRNWDYRFCWLRDSSLVLDALMGLDLHDEAMRFWGWLEGVVRRDDELRVLYRVDGSPAPAEVQREDLPGHRDSRPVRFGNDAAGQQQHDLRGYVLDAALRCQLGMRAPHDDLRPILRRFADESARLWRGPDRGIWEIRGEERHYVHSKLMCWVALDRAVQLSDLGWLDGDVGQWRRERAEVRNAILEHGYDRELGSFVQAFGERQFDAAVLEIPLFGLLPGDDPRIVSTIDAVTERLGDGDLLRRYVADDGLPGGEGAFVACSFWRVEALARAGRIGEATEAMRSLVARCNDVGLLAEQIDPGTGAFLGNFPQALSHLALVRAALVLRDAGAR